MKQDFLPFILLEKIFGEDFSVRKRIISDFPYVYSRNFRTYDVEGSFSFIYVVPLLENTPFDLLKGMYNKCQNTFDKRIVLFLSNSSNKYKQMFIDSHINFVASDSDHCFFEDDKLVNIYDFNERIFRESYTKITQLIVNFYLTNDIKEYSVREIANQFDFSFSSVSRANSFLHEINAINKIGTGNSAKYIIESKKDLLDKVKPFFINPIKNRKMIFVNKDTISNMNGFLSGENALSYYSNLEVFDDFIELAVNGIEYKRSNHAKENNKNDGIVCYLEEFIYDPSFFAVEDTISPLDTYIIAIKRYSGNDDPRINNAIKVLERRAINGK